MLQTKAAQKYVKENFIFYVINQGEKWKKQKSLFYWTNPYNIKAFLEMRKRVPQNWVHRELWDLSSKPWIAKTFLPHCYIKNNYWVCNKHRALQKYIHKKQYKLHVWKIKKKVTFNQIVCTHARTNCLLAIGCPKNIFTLFIPPEAIHAKSDNAGGCYVSKFYQKKKKAVWE